MSDSDEEIFLTQISFRNSLGSSKLDEIDVLEVTDGLFNFQHANQDIELFSFEQDRGVVLNSYSVQI